MLRVHTMSDSSATSFPPSSHARPEVRFALPPSDSTRIAPHNKISSFNVRRVYSSIFLVCLILVMGILRLGREEVKMKTPQVRDGVGSGTQGEAFMKRNLDGVPDSSVLWDTGDGELLEAIAPSENLECRLVHSPKFKDKCTFIKANCPDEEAGLLSYLQLYYCRLPNAQWLAFIINILWLCLLFSTIGIAASDFLCINLSTIASILGMSESLAGVTFLAFGNGSPDVFSTFAAMSTHSGSLAVGELIGAASFITAVVAGSMSIVRPFKVARKSFVRDVGFFIVAAAFSMVFLADGRLNLWECVVMVAFYVFYVLFVVTWHWYFGRRRVRRERENAARSQFQASDNQPLDIEVSVEDEDGAAGGRRSPLSPDLRALEAPVTPVWKVQAEEEMDEETRDRYLKELRDGMQLSRPSRGRRNTIAPIRPSLVGALDFRSAVHNLEKSRSQDERINLRGYSDDPDHLNVPRIGEQGFYGHGGASASDLDLSMQRTSASGRNRAVSANDAGGLRLDTNLLNSNDIPEIDLLGPDGTIDQILQSPRLSLSPSHSPSTSRASSPRPGIERHGDHLAPPTTEFHNPNYQSSHGANLSPTMSPTSSPRLVPRIEMPQDHTRSRSVSPVLSPRLIEDELRSIRSIRSVSRAESVSARGRSRSGSLLLPPPSLSPQTVHSEVPFDGIEEPKPWKWWPYQILPPPEVLFSALFPTLYDWKSKNFWEKCLGAVAAPSIFLLTITLPVVEPEGRDDDLANPDPGLLSPHAGHAVAALPPDSPSYFGSSSCPNGHSSASNAAKSPAVAARPSPLRQSSDPHPHPSANQPSSPKEWNRWLVSTQIVLAPLFVVFIAWANMDESHSLRNLVRLVLCSLVISLIALAFLNIFTDAAHPPRYRPLLCFLGFIVAIAWISTIANEVVGVLKALGVIVDMSDAILGLTIFAVGNSCGDLVADITVARLGFPVMALSACFGGPMLNILLGIGIGGLYMTIKDSTHKHEKHPSRPIVYKPYLIEVSSTLMISGITLLVTLVGLLIVVPMNGWRMSRKVGWGLVALWSLSTIGNVIVEIVGLGGELGVFW